MEADPTSRKPTSSMAMVLAASIGCMVVLRAAVTTWPAMWAWGINDQRFLPPAVAWFLTALCVATLAPPVSRRLALGIEQITAATATLPGAAHLVGAIATGLAVWLLSDLTWFTGDYLLRLGTLGGPIPAEKIFPQALPLDLFMHVTLPRFLARVCSIDVGNVEYLLGAIKAAVLGALAVEYARLLRVRGAVAAGAATIVAAGGYLGMLTGCGQAYGDMCLIVAAVGMFGLRVCLTGTGLAGFSISVAVGLCMHREAIALLPAWLAIVWIMWPSLRQLDSSRRLRAIAWLSLPLATLLAMTPRIVHLILGFDRTHLMANSGGGAPSSWVLDPQRLLDLLNLVVRLSPLAIVVPGLAWLLAPRLRHRSDAGFMATMVVPWILGMLLVHPEDQGMVRDWGTFAAAGLAVSMFLSWMVAEAIREAPAHAWIGIAIVVGCVVPTVEQLLVSHSPSSGMRRVNAYVDESPHRPDAHRTLALDYLGTRNKLLGNADESARAYERAAAITPARRILYNWALAEADGGHYQRARDILQRLIASGGATPDAFYTLGAVSYLLGDPVEARKAVLQTLALKPTATVARQLLSRIDAEAAASAARP